MPRISVVLPIYNVERYLAPCLESLQAQSVQDFEAIMVDDGSTDASADVARDFEGRDERFKLVQQPNAGLSAARNTGTRHASGEFLSFVDSDDLLPPNAYELLMGALDETGSDFATGNVRRLNRGYTTQSKFLREAFAETRLRTHVTKYRPLMADRTAWNKLWRRSFWDANGYEFPHGRTHEDIPVVLPAHFTASAVDVISEPVYFWRVREAGEKSITQRRLEQRALLDRMAAVEHVSGFLRDKGMRKARRWYDESLLADDFKLYLNILDVADDDYRKLFLDRVNAFYDASDAEIGGDLRAIDRVKWHLVRGRMLPELLEVLRFEREELKDTPPVVVRGRAYGDYPYRGDARVPVPADAYRLGPELTLTARLDELQLDGRRLTVRGWTFIDGIGAPEPGAQKVRLTLLRRGPLRRVRYVLTTLRLKVREVRRPDATELDGRTCDATWSGFEGSLDLGRLRRLGRWRAGTWDLFVTVKAGRERRRRVRWFLDSTPPVRPVELPSAEGALVRAAATDDGEVLVEVLDDRAVVRAHRADGDAAEVTGELVPPGEGKVVLEARREDRTAKRRTPVTLDGTRFTARLDLEGLLEATTTPGPPADEEAVFASGDDLEAEEEGDAEAAATDGGDDGAGDHDEAGGGEGRPWELHVVSGGRRRRLALPADADGPRAYRVGDHEVALLRTDRGDAALRVRRPSAVLTGAEWTGDGVLELTGTWPATAGAQELVLQPGKRFGQHVVDVDVDEADQTFTARLRPAAMPSLAGPRPLTEGWWGLYTHPPGDHDDEKLTHVVCSAELLARGPLEHTAGRKTFAMTSRRRGGALLIASRDLVEGERGRYHQQALRRTAYLGRRAEPLRDAVVYEASGGRAYAGSPRMIHEELVRRGAPLEHLWVVRDGQAVVPDGVTVLPDGSREHHEALATARFLVADDRFPGFFERREDQITVQTWHGTPIKRVGLDAAAMRNTVQRFEHRWRGEVANWSYLVSPSPYATPILRRAYAVGAEVLETGLPRTDLLAAPGREARERAVRERLGVPEGKRVVLYAPTFRDHLVDRQGRYGLEQALDLDRLRDAVGGNTVVLYRPHPQVREAAPQTPDGFVRDVSTFPDGTELLLAADALITDYSSLMADYAVLDRPTLCFAYDLEAYRDRTRGLYVDLESVAPGPVLRTTEEVADALGDLDAVHAAHADRRRAFREVFCALDDGRAAARVADRVFG